MTEKRFAVTQTILGSGIYDFQAENEVCESYDEDAYKEVVRLLNELHEKDKDGEECYRKLLEKYDSLKEENEQLKTFIKQLQNHKGDILLLNGYGYTKKYIKRLLK